MTDSSPSLLGVENRVCLRIPKGLPSGHEDVRSGTEEDNKWLLRRLKMVQDNWSLDLQHFNLAASLKLSLTSELAFVITAVFNKTKAPPHTPHTLSLP